MSLFSINGIEKKMCVYSCNRMWQTFANDIDGVILTELEGDVFIFVLLERF